MSQQVNLLGPLLRPRTISYPSATAATAGVCAAAAIMLAFVAYAHWHLSEVERRAQATDRALKDARAAADAATAQRAGAPAAAGTATASLAAQLAERQRVLEALNDGSVGTTSGFSHYMMAFSRQRVPGVWLTGFDVSGGGKDLELRGRALAVADVPSYLERLKREPSLQGQSFSSMSISQSAPPAEVATGEQRKPSASGVSRPVVEFALSSRPAMEAQK